MNRHLTRRSRRSQSQILPPAAADVASGMTLDDTYVGLCDWHGQLVWKSGTGVRVQVGEPLWKHVASRSRDALRSAVANVATLREACVVEVENERGEMFRLWMWPLNEPEIAICALAVRIPNELSLLTDRERACLGCLAKGMPTRDIAKELDIGLTTVHTHLRRSRTKLGLPSVEALIAYAARYFYVPACTGVGSTAPSRTRGA